MRDEAIIGEIEKNLDFLASRGMSATATSIKTLITRFKALKETHRLLAEREERLTQEVVYLRNRTVEDVICESSTHSELEDG